MADDEPYWLADDRTVVAVWQQERRARCARCGTWEWEFVENPEAWHADHGDCPGCRLLDLEQDTLAKSKGLHMGTRTFLARGP